MVGFLLPIIAGAGAFLAGKSGGGGAIEIATTKKQSSIVNANFMPFTFSPTTSTDTTNTYITNSPNASVTTKKEGSATQGAYIPLTQNVAPSQAQGGVAGQGAVASSEGGGLDMFSMALYGGIGLSAWYLLKGKGDKK